MTRRGLSLALALLIAGGPWLCCCTARRIVAATVPEPTVPTGSCCRDCCGDEPKAPAKPAPTDDCPCRDKTAPCCGFVATPVKSAAFDAWLAVPAVACDIAPVPPALPVGVAGQPLRELPFLTVSDLLHAQHRLRC